MSDDIAQFLNTWPELSQHDGWELQDYINELNEVTLRD